MKPWVYVTIGAHHRGPHVDALYALAERCGAIVVVVDGDYRPIAPVAPYGPRRRVPYAGQSQHESKHFRIGGAE